MKNAKDIGIAVIRCGLGVMFMYHGWSKMTGGSHGWEALGRAIETFGIHGGFRWWGLMAAVSEFFGGACLIIGLGTRIAAFFMLCVMVTAAAMHMRQGNGLLVASHAIENGIVFLGLICMGAGSFSIDAWIAKARKKT